jgi:hypothetical protein
MEVLGPLPSHPAVKVIDDASLRAFCAGYLQPRVYISRGALDLLSPEELGAVLLHEDHHRSTCDPLTSISRNSVPTRQRFAPAPRGPLASALLAFDAAVPTGVAGISPDLRRFIVR